MAGFFLTLATEKTKTQGQNSSKKLSLSGLGSHLTQIGKTQGKNSSCSQISRGTPKYTIFIAKYFQKKGTFWKLF